jgi:hypothetical protein
VATQTLRLVNWAAVLTLDVTYDDVSNVCASLAYAVAAGVRGARLVVTRSDGTAVLDRQAAGGASGTVSLPQPAAQRLALQAAAVVARRAANFGVVVEYAP